MSWWVIVLDHDHWWCRRPGTARPSRSAVETVGDLMVSARRLWSLLVSLSMVGTVLGAAACMQEAHPLPDLAASFGINLPGALTLHNYPT